MKKEEFFEILGEIDENFVQEARQPKKRPIKIKWKAWGAAAACLAVICVTIFCLFPTEQEESDIAQNCSPDAAPMICVNGSLYQQSPSQTAFSEKQEAFIYLGEIKSDINKDQTVSDGVPTQDFQANHPVVGSKVYQYGEDIVLLIDNKYWLYEWQKNPEDFDWDSLTEQEKMELDPLYNAD